MQALALKWRLFQLRVLKSTTDCHNHGLFGGSHCKVLYSSHCSREPTRILVLVVEGMAKTEGNMF